MNDVQGLSSVQGWKISENEEIYITLARFYVTRSRSLFYVI